MNVLSLFDGMSCGQIALNRLGIKYEKYFAAEIDKYAIKVAKANYPDTIHLGDVQEVKASDLPTIDLLLGGSPCQGFSFAGKQLNFEDPRSKLFFEYVRLLRECKPKYFLLENVKMKKEYEGIITEHLGVEPILINSSLVSAQNRKRLYWTNIPGVDQPQDKGILLRDIIHEAEMLNVDLPDFNLNPSRKGMNGIAISANKPKAPTVTTNKGEGHKILVPENVTRLSIATGILKGKHAEWFANNAEWQIAKRYCSLSPEKAITMTARQYANWNGNYWYEILSEYIVPFDKTLQILDKEVELGKVGYFRKDSQANRVYFIHGKAVTLTGESGGGAAKMGQYLFGSVSPSKVSVEQYSDAKRFYTLTAQGKHGVLVEGYIRKLTPVECERLQTIEDGYSASVSNAQRYKMLGNGWTVDVICHILSKIK